jgi:hypothetical protein
MVTDTGYRCEVPVAIRDRVKVYSSVQEETALLRQLWQRVLQTVEDLRQQSRTQIYAHQLAGELYFVTDFDAVGHFVDLHAYFPVVDTDYLSFKALIVNEDVTYFILSNGAIEVYLYKVAVDSGYKSCLCFHIALLLQTVYALLYPVE